jgi:hypothetical protein
MRYRDEKKQNQQRREELLEEAKDMSDMALLDEVLTLPLEDYDRKAFHSMREKLGQYTAMLTPKQRGWAEDLYVKFSFDKEDTEALNMISNGLAPRGNVPTFAWEQNRPLKPPGR